MSEELGVIGKVAVGMRDCKEPTISFDIATLSGNSLQAFSGSNMLEFIEENDLFNVFNLEGKMCVVEVKEGLMLFKRLWK
jgi:hypothetical protein